MSSPTSAPITAPRRRRDWLRAPRKLSLTRPGKFFLLITIGIGFGAINTGNNLLFLLLGMMLSLIIASGLLSEAVLRHVRATRRLPRRLEANQPAPGGFRITNRGNWPSLSFQVAEQNPLVIAGPLSGQRVGPTHVPWWKFWKPQDETAPLAAAYCLRAPAHDELHLGSHYVLPARGRYRLPGVEVSTRFPFGLFEKSRAFSSAQELVVLPEILPAHTWIDRLLARWGDESTRRRGPGEEFFGLRDYRPGEDRRKIHWKSSARRGKPVVRETEAKRHRALAVVFDHRALVAKPDAKVKRRFERGLSRLCGLLQSLHQRGIQTHLVTCTASIPASDGLIAALHHLATIDLLSPSAPPPQVTDELQAAAGLIFVGFESPDHPSHAESLFLSLAEDPHEPDVAVP
jgi:uncharacterized protein (DUF58 family)